MIPKIHNGPLMLYQSVPDCTAVPCIAIYFFGRPSTFDKAAQLLDLVHQCGIFASDEPVSQFFPIPVFSNRNQCDVPTLRGLFHSAAYAHRQASVDSASEDSYLLTEAMKVQTKGASHI